jgi:hypothetical protein
MARDFDRGRAVVKNSIAIRKELAKSTHLIHSLRKEIVERREKWRVLRDSGGKGATAPGRGNNV